ncbi:unnamed protein product [Ambrosiozyma monospora]|uniref:Unnamed protein product n=1 Tax=Ambrosiozyma monospora TaxID=43982 RepID=A0ACB5T7P2_AMBMO|nr:unnamed protein product [Ambrosiozyma monospora]
MTGTSKSEVSKDHYYRIASDLESERISSAAALIKELTNVDNEKEWNYALDRLIKGLCSSRASARIGFSMCLGEILSILISEKKTYSIPQFLTDLDTKLSSALSNKNNGKNERALIFGELFGLQSLLNSGVVLTEISKDQWRHYQIIVEKLVSLSLKKSWIRETCFATIYKSLVEFSVFEKNPEVIVGVLKLMEDAELSLTTEGLLMCLAIPFSQRGTVLKQAGCTHWKNGDPLARGNLE